MTYSASFWELKQLKIFFKIQFGSFSLDFGILISIKLLNMSSINLLKLEVLKL